MASPYMKVAVAEIKARNRFRKDVGDLADLLDSIPRVGLLHPLVVDANMKLIAGTRRLAAVKKLGWSHVAVTVCHSADDALKALEAERDENSCRRQLSPSEAVALGEAIEKLEKPKAAERQKEGVSQTEVLEPSGNLPEGCQTDVGTSGETREKAAQAAGMGARTYEKAKEVVNAAKENPELKPLVAEMDATGKVDGAFRKLKAAQAAEAAEEPESPLPPEPEDDSIEAQIKARNSILESFARRITALIAEIPEDEWLDDLNRVEGVRQKLKGAAETIRSAKCHCECPMCKGDGCRKCHDTGRVTKAQYDTLV
jgi:ParB/RepB/Spo0J family partition protein